MDRVCVYGVCLLSFKRVLVVVSAPWTIQSMGFSRSEYWSGQPFPSPGDLPNSGIKPRSLALLANSLPSELPEKPMNNGVGSLSLLQGIFPIQESNQGLLHCRQILYKLSYHGSPSHNNCYQLKTNMIMMVLFPMVLFYNL